MVAIGHVLTASGRVTVLASEYNPLGHVIVQFQGDTGTPVSFAFYTREEIRQLINLLEQAREACE